MFVPCPHRMIDCEMPERIAHVLIVASGREMLRVSATLLNKKALSGVDLTPFFLRINEKIRFVEILVNFSLLSGLQLLSVGAILNHNRNLKI